MPARIHRMAETAQGREEGVHVGLRREEVRQDLHRGCEGSQVCHLHVPASAYFLGSL